MIVKTIEEMHDNFLETFNVIQTLRIYKEKVSTEIQKLKCNYFKEEQDEPKDINIKHKISALLNPKSSLSVKDPNQKYSRGIPRYKLVE